jgi:hypothetical protein
MLGRPANGLVKLTVTLSRPNWDAARGEGTKKLFSNIPEHFRTFPNGQLPFFSADAIQVQCSRLPPRARGQKQRVSMSPSIDENAIAHLVAKILAEYLRGADVPATAPAMSIPDFCEAEGMSRASFRALQLKGIAPQLTEIIAPGEPGINRGRGMRLFRISAENRRAWHEMIAQARTSEAAELEIARAHAQRMAAAKLAVASPAHISKTRTRPVQGRRRR